MLNIEAQGVPQGAALRQLAPRDASDNDRLVHKESAPSTTLRPPSNTLNVDDSDRKDSSASHSTTYTQTTATFTTPSSESFGIPSKSGCTAYRWLRWKVFSTYRRIFTVVFVANVTFLLTLLVRSSQGKTRVSLSVDCTTIAVSFNLLLSIFARNEHIINLLFRVSSSLPPTAPLFLRRVFAKIYSYGGLHSGCAIAALAWYIASAGIISYHFAIRRHVNLAIAVLTYMNLIVLITITIFAHPTVRLRIHNWFECTHRFAGWLAVALFWAQIIVMSIDSASSQNSTTSHNIAADPSLWALVVLTLCIAYPWLRIRRRSITVEPLSNHAIRIHFDYAAPGYCSTVRLANNPLKETHAFAAIPSTDQSRSFSVVVSNAGDWTHSIISDPPTHLFTKGAPTYGVLRVAEMFKPVLIVATGSGIGPCLSLFRGCPNLDCRVLWSTRAPCQTYGQSIVEEVYKADANAIVVDTSKQGRPNMIQETYNIWKESGCEAVVVISNFKVTRSLVYAMEARGVPAYGPIFDS